MKVKQTPEDFLVRELLSLPEGDQGRFGYYRLEKRNIGTLEAVAAFCRARRIARRRVSHAGLKDRHAFTVQYLSIEGRPVGPQNFASFRLAPEGRGETPVTPALSAGNAFTIVLRDLAPNEVEQMQQRAAALRRTGCPNYFDDQRFGSFVPGQAPFGRLLVEGRYEEALRRYFTDPSPGDNKRTRSAKQRLNDLWGQWDRLLKDLPRGEPRAAAAYLKDHPEDFAGALDHLNAPLHSLLTHAWQSALWNRMLSKVMERLLPEEVLDHHPGRAGAFVFADRYPADALAMLFDLQLPLPHARAAVPEPAVEAWSEVLEEEGMAAEELRIRKLRRLYLKKGERDAWLDLGSLQLDAAGVDTLNEGRLAVTLRLQLPPGAYATIVIKELTRGFWRPSQRRRRRRRQK